MTTEQKAKLKALGEALKEVGRLALIAAISGALVAIQAWIGGISDPTTNGILTLVIGALIRAWDKYRYTKTKALPEEKTAGVLPF